MVKEGPCYHCGVTSTPLWRNGPPEKPVLCNACGSRWRTKGTLSNYIPLHARADIDGYQDHKVTRIKSISVKRTKEGKVLKRKPNHNAGIVGTFEPDYYESQTKDLDEDASNRSSSGSAISNSESCAQFGSADGSDLTGPAQSNVWDSMVPSRKRTCVGRPKPSPVEKLTKELYTILCEQQSSCFSASSEEDLLFESQTPMVSVEIGHGSVLIRHPSSIARDEESEASSLSVGKQYSVTESCTHCLIPPPPRKEVKEFIRPTSGLGLQLEQLKRDQFQNENIHVLEGHNSPLCDIDLNDILNFEEYGRCLTNQEQQQLLKYLPPSDAAQIPESIKSLFANPQFKENVSSYQQLLSEGVFDLSFSETKIEECKSLKDLSLRNLSKSRWVAHYHLLKNCKDNAGRSPVGKGASFVASTNLVGATRSRDSQSQKVSETKMMKSPRRNITKAACDNKERMDSESSCFSPRSLFALPPDGNLLNVDSIPFVDESSDQDQLLDLPSNGSSAQAELLHLTRSFGLQTCANSSNVV